MLAWLMKFRRDRDQLTVELAEEGVAPADEVRATEERIEEHHEVEQPPRD